VREHIFSGTAGLVCRLNCGNVVHRSVSLRLVTKLITNWTVHMTDQHRGALPVHCSTRDWFLLVMGKMILSRELVLSVRFTITIRSFDSFVTSDYVIWRGISQVSAPLRLLGSIPRENRQDILYSISKRPTNIYTTCFTLYVSFMVLYLCIYFFTIHLILHYSGITELSWS
jgi:hypothetical protein